MDILDRLDTGFGNLIAALDGQDADAIIDAAAAIRPMIVEIESLGAWREDSAGKQRLIGLSKLIDASRFRVNKLTELSQKRAENLTQAMGSRAMPLYQRPQ